MATGNPAETHPGATSRAVDLRNATSNPWAEWSQWSLGSDLGMLTGALLLVETLAGEEFFAARATW